MDNWKMHTLGKNLKLVQNKKMNSKLDTPYG